MNLDELYTKCREKAEGLTVPPEHDNTLILLDITGDDPRRWLVDFRDRKVDIREFASETPNVIVSASAKTILAIAERKLKPTMAFFTGRLKIKGDKSLLTQLSQIWPD